MSILWVDEGEKRVGHCAACGHTGPKSALLRVGSPFPPYPQLTLLVCDRCGSVRFPELVPPDYQETGKDASFDFYLEQNAGIDEMVEPLFAVDPTRVRRFLEVGCAFGFALDFARAVFGWQVKGIDPGPGGRFGREMLGLDIVSRYLETPADVGGEPFDLVLCSELIEHFHEPEPLFAILRTVMVPNGVLLLTTPNGARVGRHTPESELLRLLCPGFHATIYSPQGLECALRRAGFTEVSVIEVGCSLRAAAVWAPVSDAARAPVAPVAIDLTRSVDRARYRDYLRLRGGDTEPTQSLGIGMRYRLLKESVHIGDYATAETVLGTLAAACRQRWGIDLDRPQEFAAELVVPDHLDVYHPVAPFCLCGLFYFVGMLAWQHRDDPETARAAFQAAALAAERLRSVLYKTGGDDGETLELGWRARGHDISLEALTAPEQAAARALAFAHTASPLLGELPPAGIATSVLWNAFTTLISRSAYDAAEPLVALVKAAPPSDSGEYASVSFALGLFELNHRRDPAAAASRFGAAFTVSRRSVLPMITRTSVLHVLRRLAHRLPLVRRLAGRLMGRRGTVRAVPLSRFATPPFLGAGVGVGVPVSAPAPSPAPVSARDARPAPESHLLIAHMIDILWCDRHGVFVKGWAHAFEHPVTALFLESGTDRVEITTFHERPDLLNHYPKYPHVVQTGFAAYLACRPFRPVFLHVVTAAGTATLDVEVPAHLNVAPPEPAMPLERFIRAMKERHATVLEIGARPVGDMTLALSAHLAPECRYIAFDIHDAPGITVVGDAHFLSHYVPPGTVDGIFSVAVLEHLQAPWLVAAEINRTLRIDGLVLLVVPQTWPVHEMPNDFWRLSSEGLKVLFSRGLGFEIIETGMSNAMALFPNPARRTGSWLEMPLAPCYGESFVLARKVAEITEAVAWPGSEDMILQRSGAYPRGVAAK